MENLLKSSPSVSSDDSSFESFDLNKSRRMFKSVCLSKYVDSNSQEISSNHYEGVSQLIRGMLDADECDEEALYENDCDELDSQKNCQDNEDSCPGSTDADSEEDYESHFEALDELSEILCEDNSNNGRAQELNVPFQRPSNPISFDREFCMPRCNAPAPFEREMVPQCMMRASNGMLSSGNGPFFVGNESKNYISMSNQGYFQAGVSQAVFFRRPSSFSN